MDDAATLNANWTAAYGQLLGAFFTAIAAFVAAIAARQAKKLTKAGVKATQRQTEAHVLVELLRDYSSADHYDAFRDFGRFVGNDKCRKARFARMTRRFRRQGRTLGPEVLWDEDFVWVVTQLEKCPNLMGARRLIHHYYKRIWSVRKAGLMPVSDMLLLTAASSGYRLWRDEVLPATLALGIFQRKRGRGPAIPESWPEELIGWVQAAGAEDEHRARRLRSWTFLLPFLVLFWRPWKGRAGRG